MISRIHSPSSFWVSVAGWGRYNWPRSILIWFIDRQTSLGRWLRSWGNKPPVFSIWCPWNHHFSRSARFTSRPPCKASAVSPVMAGKSTPAPVAQRRGAIGAWLIYRHWSKNWHEMYMVLTWRWSMWINSSIEKVTIDVTSSGEQYLHNAYSFIDWHNSQWLLIIY